MTKLVLPEPETPVTQVNAPTGIWTVMSFKLCSFAPLITRNLPVPLRRSAETGVFIRPERYWPVSERGLS